MAHRAPVLSSRAPGLVPGDARSSYDRFLGQAADRRGAWVRDPQGRTSADFCNAYGSVLLGWADPDVEAAVATLSGATLTESVIDRIAALSPSAEAVALRASVPAALADALAAARAVTGRERAYVCDDRTVPLGDLAPVRAALERAQADVAAVVIEPMDADPDFLEGLRGLADRYGAVLIFDESKSALRVHEGGVQTALGVTPDVTILGPTLANGRPLAAVVGRIDILRAIGAGADGWPIAESSLAAAEATLEKVERLGVVSTLRVIGAEIEAEVEALLIGCGADHLFDVCGDPTWSVVAPRASAPCDGETLKACLAAALYEQGVISFGAHIPSFAVGDAEITRLLYAYEAALPHVTRKVDDGVFDRRQRTGRRAYR